MNAPQDDAVPGEPPDLVIRELESLADYQECCALQEETWGQGFSERVPTAILRVSQKIGGVTAGAFDGQGRMLGFVFGMTGLRHGELAHWSDMLAVRPAAQGRNLGERLKHYQRERVLALGVKVMYWTYDPLVARNAHFNINRLGARPVEYVPDMYGSNTGSTLHGALPTDRLVIAWRLLDDRAGPSGADLPLEDDVAIPLANPLGADGLPRAVPMDGVGTVRVQVPREPPDMRTAADVALAWRMALRASLVPLLGGGHVVTRFVRAADSTALPYYVLHHPS